MRRVVGLDRGRDRARHQLQADDELPAVFADPDKFTQVVTNLVENAVRHGQGQVTVRCRRRRRPHGVRLMVDDEGEGIPAELRRRVFTKFWTTGAGGTGLGMYIVGGLSRAHGGWVTIDEAPGGGAPRDGRLAERGPRPELTGRDLHTTFTSRPRRPTRPRS